MENARGDCHDSGSSPEESRRLSSAVVGHGHVSLRRISTLGRVPKSQHTAVDVLVMVTDHDHGSAREIRSTDPALYAALLRSARRSSTGPRYRAVRRQVRLLVPRQDSAMHRRQHNRASLPRRGNKSRPATTVPTSPSEPYHLILDYSRRYGRRDCFDQGRASRAH